MSTVLTQTLIYMTCTLILGFILGWVGKTIFSDKTEDHLNGEVSYWKKRLDQTRLRLNEGLEQSD